MAFAILLFIFGCATAYSSSFIVFIVLRFFVAFCSIAVFTTAFVYCKKLLDIGV